MPYIGRCNQAFLEIGMTTLDKGKAAADDIVAVEAAQEHELIRLSREEQIAFVSAVLKAAEPGARLRKAADSYRRKSGL